jgi:hypothetical protein
MRHRATTLIAAAALLGATGCGSDDDDEQAATTTTPAAGAQTTTTDTRSTTTQTTTASSADGERLSPEGRAVLDASQDLAADVSETAQEFARGRIDEDEAVARLELSAERADDLGARAQELPIADRARDRLVSLNEEIERAATAVAREMSSGRTAGRDEINEQIAMLREEARSTVDAISRQLDRQARERVREALDRIGVGAPG